jgi:AcrR family transcriptional regulator
MPKLKKEYADLRKKEILKAAWMSIMEKGYEKTTMREIAKRMNASTGVLYTYFKTKDEILKETQTRMLERNAHRFSEMDKRNSVREIYVEIFNQEYKSSSAKEIKKNSRGMVSLVVEASKSEGIRKLLNSHFRDIEKGGAKQVERGIKNGEIHSFVDPKALVGMMQALEMGLWLQIALIDGLDIHSYIDNIIKIVTGNIWKSRRK